MAQENDAGRSIKVTLTIITGVIVVLAGGGYLLWSWLSAPPPAVSQVDIARVGAAPLTPSAETPAYREQLDQLNKQGVKNAEQENHSFIASIPLEQTPVVTQPTAPAVPVDRQNAASDRHRSETRTADQQRREERRQQALDVLLKEIQAPSAGGLQVARMLGAQSGQSNNGQADTSGYSGWSASLNPHVTSQLASYDAAMTGQAASATVIPPYWRGPGIIDIGVDSDNSTTPVIGRFLSGAYRGAVLKAPDGARLAGDGVVIHFTEMAFNGVNYQVDAYALQDDTLLANVATDVNHRYFSRGVWPAILTGIGGVGEMYAQANTQVVSNQFSTTTTRPGSPDAKAVGGVILGGAASKGAQVLSEDAARLPATQVTVAHGQVVAIQFMRGVYTSDAVTDAQLRGSATALPTSSSPSIAQLRERIRSRIDANKTANTQELQP